MRPGRWRGLAQPPHLDVEARLGPEGHAKVRRALADAIRLVFDREAALVEQAQSDCQLERQVAPALIVTQPAGLLANLVAINLGERSKARRRAQPRSDLGGERGTVGAEDVSNQLVERDRRT